MLPVIADFKYLRIRKGEAAQTPPDHEDIAADSRWRRGLQDKIPQHISNEDRRRTLLETARAERGLYLVPHLRIYDTNANPLAVRFNEMGSDCFDYDPAKAQRHFRTAILLDPSCALAYNNLGLALIETGDLQQAQVHLAGAINLDPKMDIAYSNRGLSYLEQGSFGEAFGDFNQALQLAPYDPIYWNNLGILFLDIAKPETALDLFKQAINLDNTNPMLFGNRGLAYKQMGDWPADNRDFATAIELDESQDAATPYGA